MKRGYVYLARMVGTKLVKIGFSQKPSRRIDALQCQTGINLELISLIPKSNFNHERILHRMHSDLCVHGEWFRDSDREIEESFTATAVELIARRRKLAKRVATWINRGSRIENLVKGL